MSEPNKDDLLRRVTSPKQFKAPPPARAIPGIHGAPPIPEGQVVHVSAEEGWNVAASPQVDPTELAAARAAQAAAAENMIPQGDPRHVLQVPEAVPLSNLPPEEQAKLFAAMQQLTGATAQPATAPQRPSAEPRVEIDMDIPELQSAAPEASAKPTGDAGQPQPAPATGMNTMAPTQITHCPNCLHNLAAPVVPEPPYHTKLAFLHSILGEKCYEEERPIFGGAVIVTLRALNAAELDVIFEQVWREHRAGKLGSELDFWERVNRYRLMLQLRQYKSTTTTTGFAHNLPDGLSKAARADAISTWEEKLTLPPRSPEDTLLPEIARYVTEQVLKSEAAFRAVNKVCNQFNGMIAKLEEMATNSDFWKPTEEQS